MVNILVRSPGVSCSSLVKLLQYSSPVSLTSLSAAKSSVDNSGRSGSSSSPSKQSKKRGRVMVNELVRKKEWELRFCRYQKRAQQKEYLLSYLIFCCCISMLTSTLGCSNAFRIVKTFDSRTSQTCNVRDIRKTVIYELYRISLYDIKCLEL